MTYNGTNEEMFQKHGGHVKGYTLNCKDLSVYKNWNNINNEMNITGLYP